MGRRKRRALGPVLRSRARRRVLEAAAVTVVGVVLVSFFGVGVAMANAPSPIGNPPITGSIVTNANGSVTVDVLGHWLWPFTTSLKDVQGLHATVTDKCDHRFGAGWGIVWNDPTDTGYPETYSVLGLSASVNIGSRGVDPVNRQTELAWMPSAPCGTFIETNTPVAGAGYVTGPWMGRHVYPNAAAVPASICVVTFDLGSASPPKRRWRQFSNDDNSVIWSLLDKHSWSGNPDGATCVNPHTLPASTAPAPTTPARVTSVTTPKTTVPPAKPAPTVSPGALAFTGFGPLGQLLAIGGIILVIGGLVIYFFDVRRLTVWLLGRPTDPPS